MRSEQLTNNLANWCWRDPSGWR